MIKRHKKLFIFLGVLMMLIVAAVIIISSVVSNINQQLNDITINEVDLSKIEDGVYTGTCNKTIVSVIVKVTVKDHSITKIELVEHNNGQGAPAEVITEDVIEKQSLRVPTISGATYSSNVILKAIENALTSNGE